MPSPEKTKRSNKAPGKNPARRKTASPRARTATPRKKKARRAAAAEPPLAPKGTLSRTRRLLLAALRLWELKQGVRD